MISKKSTRKYMWVEIMIKKIVASQRLRERERARHQIGGNGWRECVTSSRWIECVTRNRWIECVTRNRVGDTEKCERGTEGKQFMLLFMLHSPVLLLLMHSFLQDKCLRQAVVMNNEKNWRVVSGMVNVCSDDVVAALTKVPNESDLGHEKRDALVVRSP